MRHPFFFGLIVLVSTSQFSLKTQVQLNVDRINWKPKLCKHHSAFLWRQPNSLLQKDTFFCQNLSNIYSNNIGNTQNRNPPKRLWAFEDVPFHVIYLHEMKLRNWSAFYSWQGRQWIGWLTQDDKSSKFSCKVKSPLKRNRRTWMEWHRGIAKKTWSQSCPLRHQPNWISYKIWHIFFFPFCHQLQFSLYTKGVAVHDL